MTNLIPRLAILLLLYSSVPVCAEQKHWDAKEAKNAPPNVLLIVVDDMGFTDLGAFGSEIETPNLDALAFQGTRLTNLYSAPTCSPTRAMLLSGVDHHLAGMGTMTEDIVSNQVGKPGYEGYLNERVLPLPEILQQGGYHTYMAGKWHLGGEGHALPIHNGFEKSFALVDGGASHLNSLPMVGPGVAKYVENGEPASVPDGFYSTAFYTSKMIEFVRSKPDDGQPFFGYLAFTAPHWPLQAPLASIDKQNGNYKAGYEALYSARLKRLVELGLVSSEVADSAVKTFDQKWDSLSAEGQRIEERRMEIYAAMIADIDHYVGELLAAIEQAGMRDNTVVLFISDNGPEGNTVDVGWEPLTRWISQCCDNTYNNMGEGDSYLWLGSNWASAVAGPVGRYKGWTHEGGIKVPGIVYMPDSRMKGKLNDTLLSVADIYPTVLELAGIEYPGLEYKGRSIAPLQGESWVALLAGNQRLAEMLDERVLAWELFGKRAVRKGSWKLISYPPPHANGQWQLYNLDKDPLESVDVALKHPQIVWELGALWDDYARKNGVVMPDRPLFY